MKNDMPEEIWAFRSGDNSARWHSQPNIPHDRKGEKYVRADLAEPVCNCGPQQACEKCYVEPVIDDGLREAVSWAVIIRRAIKQRHVTIETSAALAALDRMEYVITHALKTREKVVNKVTNDHRIKVLREMGFGHEMINDSHIITYDGYKGFFINHTNLMCAMQRIPRAFTVLIHAALKSPTNRDEEKI